MNQKKIIKLLLLSMLIVFFGVGCNKIDKKDNKFYGNVDVRTVSLAFRVSGRIKNIYFEEGEKVKRGEAIASLDSAIYREYLNQITAQIAKQKAVVEKLEKGYRKEEIDKAKATMRQKEILMENEKRNYQRYEKLINSHSTSQENYDSIKAKYESTKALYEYAKSSVALLENGYQKEDIDSAKAQLLFLISQKNQRHIDLNDTNLYAPNSGTILTRVHEIGSIVNGSQVIIEMSKDDKYWVRSYLSERYLGLVQNGMRALVYTDSNPTKAYKGVVSFISPIAEFTPKSVQTEELRTDLVYQFRINLKNFDDKIRQGMPVTIRFQELKTEQK